ncbi:MAG: serine hydrolase domain-containing protein [Myxococcota bacterium]
MEIHGHCAPEFEPVRDAFRANFEQGREVGASVAVTRAGRPVVDLWAGDAAKGGAPWQEDTIVNVYSTTKTMAAISLLVLADRGELDLDAPVARYWPEFAQNGKDDVRVSHVMSHSAGLSGFDPPLAAPEELYDHAAIADGLARQAPWWTPGDGSGYHAVTQGYLQAELVRRITGDTLGAFFRQHVAEPLGADFHIGLPPEHDARVGELVPPEVALNQREGAKDSIAIRTLRSCPVNGSEPRTTGWRRAEIPAAGGIGNARAVARIHSALACGGAVDGVQLLSKRTLDRVFEVQSEGTDRVLGVPIRFGMGFGLFGGAFALTSGERACFWGGWGGSLAVIDQDAELSVAYVMNRMEAELLGDPRGGSLVLAAYKAIGQG